MQAHIVTLGKTNPAPKPLHISNNILSLIHLVKSGFPPKQLDTSNSEKILQDMTIRSGDTLIIEESKDGGAPQLQQSTTQQQAPPPPPPQPKLVRK